MNIEGQVTIDVHLNGDTPSARVAFTQPVHINRLLIGKTQKDALEIIPSVFSLCAMAHLQAARNALTAAGAETTSHAPHAAVSQCLTEMESLRENALRIAMDWPHFVGKPVETANLKPLMHLLPDLHKALCNTITTAYAEKTVLQNSQQAIDVIAKAESLLEKLIFVEPLTDWTKRHDVASVKDWAATSRSPAARLLAHVSHAGWDDAGATQLIPLRALTGNDVQELLRNPASGEQQAPFSQSSQAPETTLLVRHADDRRLSQPKTDNRGTPGLWHRLTARLIELSVLPERMRSLITGDTKPSVGRAVTAGIGLAEVAAARGLLAHVIRFDQGRIADYRILPPTRWNFAMNGVAARALGQIAKVHRKDARILCELIVNAIDPCVGHTVRIH